MILPDNILRSGVPHAVETNLVTRHAINPRHQFLDVDPQDAERDSAAGPAADQSSHAHHPEDSPVLPAAHWQDNIQPLDTPHLDDNWQSLGSTHVQDNLQSLDSTHVQDNRQSIDQAQLRDNLQALPNGAMHDNRPSLGPAKGIEEKKLYLEKKSIRDNRQQISAPQVQRTAPQWAGASIAGANRGEPHPTTAPTGASATGASASAAAPHQASHATSNEPSHSHSNAATLALDDALRARMEKLKATVRNVNDSLSDLDDKP